MYLSLDARVYYRIDLMYLFDANVGCFFKLRVRSSFLWIQSAHLSEICLV